MNDVVLKKAELLRILRKCNLLQGVLEDINVFVRFENNQLEKLFDDPEFGGEALVISKKDHAKDHKRAAPLADKRADRLDGIARTKAAYAAIVNMIAASEDDHLPNELSFTWNDGALYGFKADEQGVDVYCAEGDGLAVTHTWIPSEMLALLEGKIASCRAYRKASGADGPPAVVYSRERTCGSCGARGLTTRECENCGAD